MVFGFTASLLLLTSAGLSPMRGAEQVELAKLPEYEQKILVIHGIAKYTSWPAQALGSTNQPVTLGVLGKDPFGTATNLIRGKTVERRQIKIEHFQAAEEVTACHLLFVSSSEVNLAPGVLAKLAANSVLTFGESEDFLKQGGLVKLVKLGNVVRWDVNVEALKASPLSMHPLLMQPR